MFARLTRHYAALLGLLLSLYSALSLQQAHGHAADSSCAGRHDVTFVSASDVATQRVVAEVACATSQIRGLVARAPVAVHLEDAAGMHAVIQQMSQRDGAYHAVQQTAGALQLLGAITADDNIASISSSKYNPTAVAQYSQYDKVLHVRSLNGRFTPLDLAILSHEYERALQDQYFNLSTLLADSTGLTHNSDARLAREAVVEGDAVTTMLNYAATAFNKQQTLQFNQQLQRVPAPTTTDYLQDLMGFPATQGTTFVTALRSAAGGKQNTAAKQTAANAAVNQALRTPPESSAEVLNASLYTSHTDVPSLPAPNVLPGTEGGWVAAASDVLGAFGISDLLQRNTPTHSAAAQAAQQAAGAWRGDRWVLYQHGKQAVLLWRLHFSSSPAAMSFVQALMGYTGGRFHSTLPVKSRVEWSTSNYALALHQRSTDVVVAIGSDKSLLPTCVQALSALGFA